MRLLMSAILLSGLIVRSAHAQRLESEQENVADNPSWTAPQKPFRIYGNTWYVGPHGLGVYLITAPTGHVLIDGGLPADAALIEANIRTLGFKLRDIKWILNSHAHFDHAGGIAQLLHDTGAQLIASAADTALLASGGRGDAQYGDRFSIPPVHVTRTVTDNERMHLGNLVIAAHSTPGHTKGNVTWTWMSCEGTRCLHMVDVASLSAPSYKLIDNPKYPDIVRDFAHSFAVVAGLPCDIPLGPHPDLVNFWTRMAKREQGNANALIDPTGCRTAAADAREGFAAQLAKQRAGAAGVK